MTDATKPLPIQISEEIAAKQAELLDSIRPLAKEAQDLLEGIKSSGEFKRLEEIMNSIPESHPVVQTLRTTYNAVHQAGHSLFMTFPETPREQPEVLTPAAFKVPEAT